MNLSESSYSALPYLSPPWPSLFWSPVSSYSPSHPCSSCLLSFHTHNISHLLPCYLTFWCFEKTSWPKKAWCLIISKERSQQWGSRTRWNIEQEVREAPNPHSSPHWCTSSLQSQWRTSPVYLYLWRVPLPPPTVWSNEGPRVQTLEPKGLNPAP